MPDHDVDQVRVRLRKVNLSRIRLLLIVFVSASSSSYYLWYCYHGGTHSKLAIEGGLKEPQPRCQEHSVHIPGATIALDNAIGEIACLEQVNVVLLE